MKRAGRLLLLLLATPGLAWQDEAPPNFEDHVAPILRENCLSCHRGSRARNGLDLRSVANILKGGSSGAAIVPGDPEGSLLYQVVAHTREPFMPPEEPPLDPELQQVLEAWIAGGARVNASDQGTAAPAAPAGPTFVAPPTAGEAVLPEGVSTQPVWSSERSDAIGALASSPTAPLVAVSGHRQVALYRVPEGELLAVLPFPEGEVTSLRFAASGALLVAAGGRGADVGLAVGWDVRTGQRVFELGDEPDVALDADVTVDHGVVALGGPDRVVRAYSARSGELLYELDPHTDWVTAVAFSPDGVLLATGDRAGGLFVWEALTGREFHALEAQRGPITSLSWRADSMVLAVGGDDGRVRQFEMERGRRLEDFRANDGVLAMQLLRDGRGVSAGRNGRARLWQANGRRLTDFKGTTGMTTAVCATFDGAHVVVGDFAGGVHVYAADDGNKVLTTLRPNPETDEERALRAARAALPGLEAAVPAADEAVAAAREALASAGARLTEARAAAEPVFSRVAPAEEALARASQAVGAAEADHGRYAASQATKDAAIAEARDAHRALQAKVDEARAHLDEALARAVRAEEAALLCSDDGARAALEEASQVAAQLLVGATAQVQLAASRAAEGRVVTEVARASAEAWRGAAEPSRAALEVARGAEQERRAEVERAKDAARAAEKVAHDAALAQAAAAEALSAAEAAAAEARRRVEEGRVAITEGEAAWAAMQTALEASGGRVPAPPAD